MEEIPIILGGETVGQGQFSREGAYMRFTGRLPMQPGPVRLWLYSRGEPFCLGVPVPEGEGCRISRRLSLGEYEALMPPITHCGDAPAEEAAPEETAREKDTLWYPLSDGCLQTVENGRVFLAFPLENTGFSTAPAPLIRTIEDKRYIIFPW